MQCWIDLTKINVSILESVELFDIESLIFKVQCEPVKLVSKVDLFLALNFGVVLSMVLVQHYPGILIGWHFNNDFAILGLITLTEVNSKMEIFCVKQIDFAVI